MKRDRIQIGPRLTPEAIAILEALQQHYGKRAGLIEPMSQPQVLEIALRDVAKREGLTVKGVK